MPQSAKPIPSVPDVYVGSSLSHQSSKRQTSQYLKTMQAFPHISLFLNLLPKKQGSPWFFQAWNYFKREIKDWKKLTDPL